MTKLAHRLNLGYNQIKSIESGDFSGLGNLKVLDLNHNQISSIASRGFIGLDKLLNLFLRNNQLTSIPSNVFTNMNRLYWLDLYDQKTSVWTATQRTAIQAQIKAVPEGASSSSFIYFDKNTGSVAGTR